jgi:hypothetical protein
VVRNRIIQILRENDLEWAEKAVAGHELPFKILGPTKPPPVKKNMFVVKAKWMSGDADSYKTDEEWYKTENPKEFEWLVDTCRVYKALMDSQYGYSEWDEINKIINPIGYYVTAGPTRKEKKIGKDATELIGRDIFTDGEYPAQLESVKIKYYDANGVEHNVALQ